MATAKAREDLPNGKGLTGPMLRTGAGAQSHLSPHFRASDIVSAHQPERHRSDVLMQQREKINVYLVGTAEQTRILLLCTCMHGSS